MTILQDLGYALRSARQRPGFTIATLVTLALGIGATTAIFSVVEGVLLRPLPYAEPDRLVVFGQVGPEAPATAVGSVSHLNFLDWREQSISFEAMALYSRANMTVTGMGEAEMVPGGQVTADFFRVFGAQPVIGRTFTSAETRAGGPLAIIVSHAFWQERLGGSPDVLEQTMEIGGVARPIVGVTPAGFEYPRGARLYSPVRADDDACGRGCVYLSGIARLAPGANVDAANAELVAIAARLEAEYPASNTDTGARVRSLVDNSVGSVRDALWILLAAVFMVLLIACANVANLLLVRGALRAGELAVRTALGASRRRILAQLMTENLLLALVGGALGLVVASWTLDMLRALAPADLPRMDGVALNGTALLFAGGLVLFSTLVFGLAPALHLARGSLSGRLLQAARSSSGPGRGWGRFAILTAEVALSTMLLLGAGLLMRSLLHMHEVDPGYETAGVAHFSIGLPSRYETPEQDLAFFTALKQRLEAVPGVDATGLVMPLPLGPSVYSSSVERTDRPSEPGRTPSMLLRTLDDGAFGVLRITLLRGRLFDVRDRHGAQPVALINRTAAEQYWPGEDPIGRQIEVGVSLGFPEEPRTIVGVVEDIRALSLTQVPEPEVIVPFAQAGSGFATVVMSARDLPGALAAARREVQSLDPNLPLIRPGTMAATLGEETASTRFYLTLLGLFAALALVLAAVGIYGVVAFQVAGRRREIGVRMALGARMQEVVRLVVWQGLRPAIAGLALGLAASAAAGRVIAGLLFDVPPHDLLTYAGVTVVLVGIVIAACLVPAGRASRIPPASALRS
jgi:putative ABC transport system permease protein